MQFNPKLTVKGLILVAIPLAFELVFVAVLGGLLEKAEYAAKREAHAKAVMAQSDYIGKLFYEAAAGLFTYSLTKNSYFEERYESAVKRIPEEIQGLENLVSDDPRGWEIAKRLKPNVLRLVGLLEDAKRAAEQGDRYLSPARFLYLRKEVEASLVALFSDLQSYAAQERNSLKANPHNEAASRALVQQWILAGVVLNIFIAIALAIFFNKGTIARLELLMDNAVRLAREDTLNPPLSGNDEIARLDRVFHDMAETLAEAAAMKQEFVAMVSHDLKTPLTSVHGFLSLLSKGVLGSLNPKGEIALKSADRSVRRLLNLVNDVLDIERMESGKLELKRESVPVASIIEASIESVQIFAEQREITIEHSPTTDEAFIDGERIIQVLVNLLSNAVKFSPKESVVAISSAVVGSWIELKVSDRGRGVPPAYKEAIFQRFHQVQPADSRGRKGTGLGLPICKVIVEAHGGLIGVDSEEGKGSTFWIRLPVAKPTETEPS